MKEDPMHIEFGDEVYSSDGAKLGTVVGLVMNSRNDRLEGLVLGEGLFHRDERLVEISAVTSSANKRVTLDATKSKAGEFPEFVSTEYIQRPHGTPDSLMMPAAGVGGPIFYDSSYTATGYTSYPGNDSFFEMAPIDPPVVETRSNLSELDVILRHGSDVMGSDGKKIGTVDEIQFDNDDRLTGFIVKAGFLFHHDLSIPASAVSEYDDDRVQLSITSEDAEQTYRV
jgi:uncharacterized protein YrrD